MNLQSKLDQFRSDNPYDVDTQAKRLLATNDKELILYVLALGLATAKQRQRHYERDYMKNVGEAPPRERERFIPGPVTGSVKVIKIKPGKREENARRQLIMDTWMVGEKRMADCNSHDMIAAIKREEASEKGHAKNKTLYTKANARLAQNGKEKMGEKWDEKSIRALIEEVYGEFRTQEVA